MLDTAKPSTIGELLRDWRRRRRRTQLELAMEADVSQRHLSCLESGRAMPSREMVLRLARHLDVPARERNVLLAAAGFAPIHRERALGDPALAAAARAVKLVLDAYAPFPALAIDRHWTIVAANDAVPALLGGVDPSLLAEPRNALRISLHPLGMAKRIVNLAEWRAHVLERLTKQIDASADPALARLLAELEGHPAPAPRPAPASAALEGVAVPLVLDTDRGRLSFLSMTTVFGTPIDLTLAELAIEAFLPADEATAEALLHSTPRGARGGSGSARA